MKDRYKPPQLRGPRRNMGTCSALLTQHASMAVSSPVCSCAGGHMVGCGANPFVKALWAVRTNLSALGCG